MNKERLLALALRLEQPMVDLAFDMANYIDYHTDGAGERCGTAACIAGWAVVQAEGLASVLEDDTGIARRAKEFLDLSDPEADDLFHPPISFQRDGETYPHRGWKATPQEAAEVIRRFVATGKVDWDLIEKGTHMIDIKDFLAFCREQGDRTFDYMNDCALEQYFKDRGIPFTYVGGKTWGDATGQHLIQEDVADALAGAGGTFSQLALALEDLP